MVLEVVFLTSWALAKAVKLHKKNGKNRDRNKVVFAEFFSIYFVYHVECWEGRFYLTYFAVFMISTP